MSSYTVEADWLCVPYSGPNPATVHVAIGEGREPPAEDDQAWRPAFTDAPAGVVKVRVDERPVRKHVWMRVNGVVKRVS